MAATIILVIDDEPLIRWSLRERLKREGFSVSEANDGARARQLLANGTRFDAVLLDYKLPDTDGLQILAQLRDTRPACPVIMMTAYGSADVQKQAEKLGVCAFVEKPFDVDALVSRVKEVVPQPQS